MLLTALPNPDSAEGPSLVLSQTLTCRFRTRTERALASSFQEKTCQTHSDWHVLGKGDEEVCQARSEDQNKATAGYDGAGVTLAQARKSSGPTLGDDSRIHPTFLGLLTRASEPLALIKRRQADDGPRAEDGADSKRGRNASRTWPRTSAVGSDVTRPAWTVRARCLAHYNHRRHVASACACIL